MPSASPPDGPPGSSGPDGADASDGEVVEVFTGDTLEEAMADAVAALGPELTVRRARKVRSGVRGLLGRDRYEVLAVPPDTPAVPPPSRPDDGDAVGSALEALLEAADEREAGGPAARPVGRPSAARPLAARPADDLPPPLRRPGPGGPAPLPPAPRSGGSPLRRLRAPVPPPPSASLPAEPRALPPAVDATGTSPRPPSSRAERRPEPVEPDVEERRDEPAPRRRGRTLGLPLSGRSPHPDPAVADHPARLPAERPRRARAQAAQEPSRGELDTDQVDPADLEPSDLEPSEVELSDVELSEVELSDVEPAAADRAERHQAQDDSAEDGSGRDAATPVPAPGRTRSTGTASARTPARGPARSTPRTAPRTTPRTAPAGSASARGRRGRAGGWSRDALAELGVPEAVLSALPDPPPRDDLAWVVALTAAIEATVPPPSVPDEQTPVVVSGHGVAGVVAVLDAGCRGIPPGTIGHAGRTAPATATELALVLRHHVTDGG